MGGTPQKITLSPEVARFALAIERDLKDREIKVKDQLLLPFKPLHDQLCNAVHDLYLADNNKLDPSVFVRRALDLGVIALFIHDQHKTGRTDIPACHNGKDKSS